MRLNYSKTYLIIAACGAVAFATYEWLAGLEFDRSGGSLGRFLAMAIMGLPLTILADLWTAWRGRAGRERQ